MAFPGHKFFRFSGILLVALILLGGCGKKITVGPSAQDEKRGKRIAMLPVINKTSEAQAARILREKVIEELYYKGYAKIPSAKVDEKISKFYKQAAEIPPRIVGELLGADSVLYCTLSEWTQSVVLAYGVISAKADFELRSAETGEVLWRESKRIDKRSLHPLKKEVQEMTLMDYEPAVHDLVEEAIRSLPNGPNFVAQGPPKRRFFDGWF